MQNEPRLAVAAEEAAMLQGTGSPTAPMSLSKILVVLVGFPVVSTLISLLLLDRTFFAWTGLDFFTALWALITLWYLAQILILGMVLRSSGWRWSDISYSFDRRKTTYFVLGYLGFALALVAFVQVTLANAALDSSSLNELSDLANLTPTSLSSRIVFVLMGLAAGLCEELVYRGFAINALKSRGINPWLAVLIAAIPFVLQHGLKSIAQFWWFFIWGLVFGAALLLTKRLYINVIIHWLVILSAILAVLQPLQ